MHYRLMRSLAGIALIGALVVGQGTWALAGTTGTVNGVAVSTADKSPVANATVIISSSSETKTGHTDSTGHFSFVSLIPDTYTVSITKDGFEPGSVAGVTVQADLTVSVAVDMQPSLKEIAKLTARSATSLVRAGTTADIYSVNALQQKAAATLGGGGGLNNAYSAIASVPGVFVPLGQKGDYQSIFVRGGNYTQVGYEYDGVPIQRAFDQYPGASLSSLGQSELQIYTGSAPVGSSSTALAGFVNQVIKTGTFPGFGLLSAGVGSPYFYHQFQAEAGGASPNRNFSYYAGLLGYNQEFVYEKGNVFSQNYGQPINFIAQNCTTPNPGGGCYRDLYFSGGAGLIPNSIEHGLVFFGAGTNLASRSSLVNFHFAVPHKRDGGRDDIQLLWTSEYDKTAFATSLSDWGSVLGNDLMTGTVTSPAIPSCLVTPSIAFAGPTCAVAAIGYVPRWADKIQYTGPLGTALTAGNLSSTQFAFFPGSPSQRIYNAPGLAMPALIPSTERDQYQQNGTIIKAQYQHNMGTNAFIRVYGFSTYSDWLQYGPNSAILGGFAGISSDYKLGSHTRGAALNFTDQMSPKHLLNIDAAYTTSNTFRFNNSAISLSGTTNSASTNTVAFLVNSASPSNGICYRYLGGPSAVAIDCGNALSSRYVNPQSGGGIGTLAPAHIGDPLLAAAGGITCGGSPCEYFSVANGINATYNTVVPKFAAFAIQDEWRPSDKLLFTLGLRYDDFRYQLPDTTGDAARKFWVNYYNTWFCYNPNAVAPFTAVNQLPGGSLPGTCSTNAALNASSPGWVQVNFSSTSPLVNDYPELQPRLGATYSMNVNNVLRFSAGKSAEPASSAFQQYNTLAPNIFAGTNQLFYALGFTSPRHLVFPEESYNYDLSWEHQSKDGTLSWKITPYYRYTKNELSTVLLDPVTNFVSAVNVGSKRVTGIEFILRKGSLDRNGFFGQLSYTYTRARETFTKLPNGLSVVDGLNLSVQQYNRLTSFCSTNLSDARCNKMGASIPAGFPCYTTGGVGHAVCLAGDVANPYWNAPVQGLFDPGAAYAVYGTLSGSRFVTGSNQSYIVPHVASLILNWKHNKLNVTPTFQFEAGGEYGRPTQVNGVNPAQCNAILATPVAGDPRYPNGALGGSPYNAAGCLGGILVPDPFTGRFDNYAQFKEPNVLAGNVSISYDISPKVTARLDLVNVVTHCWGGSSVAWQVSGNAGCNYGVGGNYVSNFFNPGDVVDPLYKFPYNPTFGSVFQSSSGGQANPFQAYFQINMKL